MKRDSFPKTILKRESTLAISLSIKDKEPEADLISCPWCYGLTYHIFGQTSYCFVCSTPIEDCNLDDEDYLA